MRGLVARWRDDVGKNGKEAHPPATTAAARRRSRRRGRQADSHAASLLRDLFVDANRIEQRLDRAARPGVAYFDRNEMKRGGEPDVAIALSVFAAAVPAHGVDLALSPLNSLVVLARDRVARDATGRGYAERNLAPDRRREIVLPYDREPIQSRQWEARG